MAAAAVVVTLIAEEVVVALPVAFIEEGVNKQAAPEGRPEQERAMLPLNPVEKVTVTDVDPEDPGAEIFTCD